MSFCGYTIYLYKSRYGHTEKKQENKQENKPENKQENKLHNPNSNPNSNQCNLDFIKEIYCVKPDTGNIDYLYCDCENFPEYKPTESQR